MGNRVAQNSFMFPDPGVPQAKPSKRYRIEVLGKPIAKKRPQFVTKDPQGNILEFPRAVNTQETEEGRFMWEVTTQLKGHGLDRSPFFVDCPIAVGFSFIMPVPKSWPKWKVRDLERGIVFWHFKKPDISNLVKFAEDCLNGLVWKDDAQIAWIKNPQKYYGLEPKTIIEIEELE